MMRKIPERYTGVVLGAVFGLVMGFFMSFFLTFLNLGFPKNFLQKWMIAYLGTVPVGFFVSLFVGPLVKKIVDQLIEKRT